jgi:hypothetical protein
VTSTRGDVDDVLRELAAISRRLAELPADAWDQRARLHERRAELRAAARPARPFAGVATSTLEDELAKLHRRRQQLLDRRLSAGHVGFGGGPGGGGFDPVQLAEMNAGIDAASGIADVEEAIRRVQAELDARRDA